MFRRFYKFTLKEFGLLKQFIRKQKKKKVLNLMKAQ